MFDSNAMHELQHLARDRYQRAGGGGAFTVYATAKAYDESRGIKEMTVWARAVYEAGQLWKSDSRSLAAGFKWDCLSHTLDRSADGTGSILATVLALYEARTMRPRAIQRRS